MEILRVGICEDYDLTRSGFKLIFETSRLKNLAKIVLTASNGAELFKSNRLNETELIILDIQMPKMDGFQVAERLKKEYPAIKILIFSQHLNKEYLRKLICMGIDGYLLKSDPQEAIIGAVEDIIEGNMAISPSFSPKTTEACMKSGDVIDRRFEELSHREKEVLAMVAAGRTTADIADKLGISENTVRNHRYSISNKLRTQKLEELKSIAERHMLVT